MTLKQIEAESRIFFRKLFGTPAQKSAEKHERKEIYQEWKTVNWKGKCIIDAPGFMRCVISGGKATITLEWRDYACVKCVADLSGRAVPRTNQSAFKLFLQEFGYDRAEELMLQLLLYFMKNNNSAVHRN